MENSVELFQKIYLISSIKQRDILVTYSWIDDIILCSICVVHYKPPLSNYENKFCFCHSKRYFAT